jgi:nitroimidazol reductase NimA-like FMN-containing flavoprotein (pyridoxamine 5'-phosphate oxidase superfamily)
VHESITMTPGACEAVLRSGVLGRMGVNTPTGPHIIPVNYSVVDDAIVVRTETSSILGTWTKGALLVFEIDHVDHDWQWGWSVSVRGIGEWVTQKQDIARILRIWAPRPWASGDRPRLIRLPWTEITGRQLGRGWNPIASMPARRLV